LIGLELVEILWEKEGVLYKVRGWAELKFLIYKG